VKPILDAAAARQLVAEDTTQRTHRILGTGHTVPTQPLDTAIAPRRTAARDLGRSRLLERDGSQP
jgi:hypothetical protein